MAGIVRYVYRRCSFGHLARNYSALFRVTTKQNVYNRRASSVSTSNSKATRCCNLSSRALLRVSGRDSENLLQGLITNDIGLLTNEKAIYTMFLNIQGRVLYDTIIYSVKPSDDNASPVYYVECDRDVLVDLQKHLKIYKLRKKVDITDISSEYEVWAAYDARREISFPTSFTYPTISVMDPRVPTFGQRLVVPNNTSLADEIKELSEESLEEYDTHRYIHGISEGIKDLPPGNALPLEANLDYMNGVSFHKGCYLGQELTARTYHTGVIRKRLMPIKFINDQGGSNISAGEIVKTADGKNAGKFRNNMGIYGLALIRMALNDSVLHVTAENGSTCELKASIPEWWPHKSSDDVSKLHST